MYFTMKFIVKISDSCTLACLSFTSPIMVVMEI